MQWNKGYFYFPRYKYTSCNQYGNRFKRIESKRLSIAGIRCKSSDADGMKKLILLSHTLDVPVRYDFDEQEAYIEVISNEALKECI